MHILILILLTFINYFGWRFIRYVKITEGYGYIGYDEYCSKKPNMFIVWGLCFVTALIIYVNLNLDWI